MQHILRSIIALVAVLFLAGCSGRGHVYLQDMVPGGLYGYTPTSSPVTLLKPGDCLAVNISCAYPEMAVPFNMPADDKSDGYTVDADGSITLPVIGGIHVEGLTVEEAGRAIADKLSSGNYLKDPLVTTRLTNFRYSVLGAVGSNGNFTADGGSRVTLLEAIAKAGDLTSAARLDRIAVIREETDGRKVYMHDIRSSQIFSSPAFYLRQNDVVYVEPRYKNRDNENRAWQLTTLSISLASVITSIIWATKN